MRRACGLGLFVVGLLLASHVQAAMNDWEKTQWQRLDAPGKFGLVVEMFVTGRAADATDALEKLLAAKPTDKEIAEMGYGLQGDVRARMVADAATAEVTKTFLTRYEQAIVTLRHDPAYITGVVDGLTGESVARQQAVRRISVLGEYAVPAVVNLMFQTQNTRVRVHAEEALLAMGDRAVRPLSQAVWVKDEALATAVCDVLGKLGNGLALGVLSDVASRPDQAEMVRQAAGNASAAILANPANRVPVQISASDYYYALADGYLHRATWALPTLSGPALPVWTWSSEKQAVVGGDVPEYLYQQEVAEENCYGGLAVDKMSLPLRALLISTYYSQKLALVDRKAPAAEKELAMAVLMGGEPAVYLSLSKALVDNDDGIAILACQTLGQITAGKGLMPGGRTVVSNPLLMALADGNPAVQFAAAQAIVAQAPVREAGNFENVNLVLPVLSWGLTAESRNLPVLVASASEDVLGHFRQLLKDQGRPMIEARNAEALMKQAAALPRPAVVFLDVTMMERLPALRVVLGMSKPVVLLAPGELTEEEGRLARSAQTAGVLRIEAGDKELKMTLDGVLGAESGLVAQLQPQIARLAAESLASVQVRCSPLRMEEVAPALLTALSNDKDSVRVPVLQALGHVASGQTTPEVLAVAADKKNSKDVRLAALDALGSILQGADAVGPDVYRDLVPLTNDSDTEIAFAAARAVAVAKFDPGQFADLLVEKKVKEIKVEAP